MSSYFREYYNEDHQQKDHIDCGLKYNVNQSDKSKLEFVGQEIQGNVNYDTVSSVFTVTATCPSLSGRILKYWAANPIVRNYSTSGSGLPYPNPEVAYENTTNQGQVLIDNHGNFSFQLNHPSAYYVQQGKTLIKPHVHFKIDEHEMVFTVYIADHFPYRSLKNLQNRPKRSSGR